MKVDLSYRTVYLSIIFVFFFSLVLSLTSIDSRFMTSYSVFGLILSASVYVIDSKYVSAAYSEQKIEIKLESKSDINRLLDKRIWLFWSFVVSLGAGFIILFAPKLLQL
ncbi:MAG: hypothetical protein R6U44_03000 [Archaeoglobaceae archaeon]